MPDRPAAPGMGAQGAAVIVAAGTILWDLGPRLTEPAGWGALLAGWEVAPYLVWLAVLPLACLARRPSTGPGPKSPPTTGGAAVCFGVCAGSAFVLSAAFGWSTRDLPPLYHDEYSYLFQARTFLAGRLSFPSHPLGPAFDQMHVLNDGSFASRYFPGTGLWLAPFVALGQPVVGMWLAGGLVAGFSALAARRRSVGAGYLAGMLVASSPTNVVLSNLRLSPEPTMVGLLVFVWAFLVSMERPGSRWPLIAGLGLGWAFLTRPLTAAGVALPFGLYLAYRGLGPGRRTQWGRAGLLAIPLAACIALLAGYNRAISGSWLTTPYGLYTACHTPSHVYGFYNASRGELKRGPDTILAYDDWSEDLTPRRAVRLIGQRWWRLLGWSLGIVPGLALLALTVLGLPRLGDGEALLLLALAGLTAAYAPYGFSGVLGWGYLFEGMPILLIAYAIVVARVARHWREHGRPGVALWWLALPVIALAVNVSDRLPQALAPASELVHPRRELAALREFEAALAARGPILVIYDTDQRESVHTTLVYNDPALKGPIVRAWFRSIRGPQGPISLEALRAAFPAHAVYLCRVHRDPQGRLRTRWDEVLE